MYWFSIIFFILFIDAVFANLFAWGGMQPWWQKHLGSFAKHFPLARGWTLYYLVLVILLGIALHQSSQLVLPF